MLVKDDHLYAVLDAGIAICHDARTGAELWKERLGGTFNSSPVLVGERIYVTNQDGETFIFKATPDGFQSLGTNQLGDNVFATPAICGNQIFMRVSHQINGKRQEFVYSLADES